ncbi:MAG TPA: hypothetical protein VFY18_09330 [Candidatus Limnocylindrales bacterium]|nr:hypothetical protein [Candidatus Limnocylindrales bacterium]
MIDASQQDAQPASRPPDDDSAATVAPPSPLPPDPSAYDSERNAAARARGLAAPYIPGGRDPDQEAADREDRRYLRILVVFVIVIVLAGFVFGLLAALVGLDGLVGGSG